MVKTINISDKRYYIDINRMSMYKDGWIGWVYTMMNDKYTYRMHPGTTGNSVQCIKLREYPDVHVPVLVERICDTKSLRCALPEESMKLCPWGFLSMLIPKITGTTMANHWLPSKNQLFKMAATKSGFSGGSRWAQRARAPPPSREKMNKIRPLREKL